MNRKLKNILYISTTIVFIATLILTIPIILKMSTTYSVKSLNLSKSISNSEICEIWNLTWGGDNSDYLYEIKISPDGYIYVIGLTSSYGAGATDLVLIKYNLDEIKIWNITWGGVKTDGANSLTMDNSGGMYLTGFSASYGVFDTINIMVLKFNSNGNIIWNDTLENSYYSSGYDIIVNVEGNLYVTGELKENVSSVNYSVTNCALIKLSTNGQLLNNITWGGLDYDAGLNLVNDINDYLYIIGRTDSYGNGNTDVMILKYDTSCNLIWNITWGTKDDEKSSGAALSSDGYLYVCGFTNKSGNYDFFVVKFKLGSELPQNTQPTVPGFELFYIMMGIIAMIILLRYKKLDIKLNK